MHVDDNLVIHIALRGEKIAEPIIPSPLLTNSKDPASTGKMWKTLPREFEAKEAPHGK